MANYAIVMNDFVTNIIVADNAEIASAISGPSAIVVLCDDPNQLVATGWYYDGNTLMETKEIETPDA